MCSFHGKRGAIVFDAPGRVSATDCTQMTPWMEAKQRSILANAEAEGALGKPTLRHVPAMAEGTRVCFSSVVVINDRLIADRSGSTIGASFLTSPQSHLIRIHHAKVVKGGLDVTSFTRISDAGLEEWWASHEDTHLPRAQDAPPSPMRE